MMRKYSVAVTTASDGTVTAYSPTVRGRLEAISYVKTDYADTVDFTITAEDTGDGLWNQSNVTASATVRPRAATHTTAGVAATLDGTVAALDKIALNTRVKIVLAQGGNAKTGTFLIYVS